MFRVARTGRLLRQDDCAARKIVSTENDFETRES